MKATSDDIKKAFKEAMRLQYLDKHPESKCEKQNKIAALLTQGKQVICNSDQCEKYMLI